MKMFIIRSGDDGPTEGCDCLICQAQRDAVQSIGNLQTPKPPKDIYAAAAERVGAYQGDGSAINQVEVCDKAADADARPRLEQPPEVLARMRDHYNERSSQLRRHAHELLKEAEEYAEAASAMSVARVRILD